MVGAAVGVLAADVAAGGLVGVAPGGLVGEMRVGVWVGCPIGVAVGGTGVAVSCWVGNTTGVAVGLEPAPTLIVTFAFNLL